MAFVYREEAARVFLAAWGADAPSRVRLIYHPEGFASTVTPCPNVGRRTLALALQEQFPALDTGELAWSHEPVLPLGSGFTTVLHREADPWLFALVAELAASGITVESAWPLATWLHALPHEWTDSGAVTVLAVIGDQACAYRHAANASRQVMQWPGFDGANPESWLREILAREPDEPVLVVTADAPDIAALASAGQTPALCHVPLAEALMRSATIPRHHTAQLLLEPPMVTVSRATFAVSFALVIAGAWSFAPWIAAHASIQADTAVILAGEQSLRAEIAHLQANAEEIAMLERVLAERPRPYVGPLVRALSASAPREAILATLSVTQFTIEARGFLAPGAADGVADRWRAALTASGGEFKFAGDNPEKPDASFRLRGQRTP